MDRILKRAANEALAFTAEHGGGTFEYKTLLLQEWQTGYVVAIGGITFKAECLTADVLAWAAKAVGGEYMTTYIGTWLDNGIVYIDAVRFLASKVDAVLLGIEHGQKAIYDCANNEVIALS